MNESSNKSINALLKALQISDAKVSKISSDELKAFLDQKCTPDTHKSTGSVGESCYLAVHKTLAKQLRKLDKSRKEAVAASECPKLAHSAAILDELPEPLFDSIMDQVKTYCKLHAKLIENHEYDQL